MSAHAINESSVGEYRSFLVRLWQSHAGGCWRASAQSIQSGEIIHFTDPTALYAYIEAQLNAGQGQKLAPTPDDQLRNRVDQEQ